MTPTEQSVFDLAKYNGCLTVHNPVSGQHRTFKIHTVRKGNLAGKRLISVLYGDDNENDYRAFGFVDERGRVIVWRRYRGTEYEKMGNIINFPEWFRNHRGLEYKLSVRCRKCNRTLTDPQSIDLGIGPVCRSWQSVIT